MNVDDDLSKETTVEEVVTVGLHQINLRLCVLVRQLLGDKLEILTQITKR